MANSGTMKRVFNEDLIEEDEDRVLLIVHDTTTEEMRPPFLDGRFELTRQKD